jgi:hypothetical protein
LIVKNRMQNLIFSVQIFCCSFHHIADKKADENKILGDILFNNMFLSQIKIPIEYLSKHRCNVASIFFNFLVVDIMFM